MHALSSDEPTNGHEGRLVETAHDQPRADELRHDPAGGGRGPNSPGRRFAGFGKAVATFAAVMLVLSGAAVSARRHPSPADALSRQPIGDNPIGTTPSRLTPPPSASDAATPAPSTSDASPRTDRGADTGGQLPRPASTPACVPYGIVDVTELAHFGPDPANLGYVTVSARLPSEHPGWFGLLCPGEKIRVLWATYTMDPAGVQHLYKSEEHTLDLDHPTWRMTIDIKWIGLCGPTWYVSRGSDPIPSTIPLGTSAFPHKFHWADENAKPGCNPNPGPDPTYTVTPDPSPPAG